MTISIIDNPKTGEESITLCGIAGPLDFIGIILLN